MHSEVLNQRRKQKGNNQLGQTSLKKLILNQKAITNWTYGKMSEKETIVREEPYARIQFQNMEL